ncbi:MAG: hypothetical protein CMI59_10785 [Parvibaculum sp.]|nr:hypothetical protein [Parvibaculum sp.]
MKGEFMRQRHILLLSIMLPLAACAPKLEDLQNASIPTYSVDQTPSADTAYIHGSTAEEEHLLGSTSLATFVAAVDGKLIEHTKGAAPTEGTKLTPGTHAVLIGVFGGDDRTGIPVRLEAEAGKKYVVKADAPKNGIEVLWEASGPPTYLYIADEETGEAVTPLLPRDNTKATELHADATGPDAATIRSNGGYEGMLEYRGAGVITIDNKYTTKSAGNGVYEVTARLSPGLHAIGIRFRSEYWIGEVPLLLEVKPAASYAVRHAYGVKRIGDKKWSTFTIWIENEKTGEKVIPDVDIPLNRRLL